MVTINIILGDVLQGNLSCKRIKRNVRGLQVTITVGQEAQEYLLD